VQSDIAMLVSRHPLLADLPGDTSERVAGCARNVVFAQGELLFGEGEPADTLYLLRRGRVALELHAPGRGRLVVETLEPQSPVGWSWLVPPYRWHFDARAIEPVGAVAVDAVCLRDKAEADPAFGYQLLTRMVGVIVDRLQATRIRLLDLYGSGGSGGVPDVAHGAGRGAPSDSATGPSHA
jgi:CRP/FNR family transcriptional regulator, cyclic AMP receptor protein